MAQNRPNKCSYSTKTYLYVMNIYLNRKCKNSKDRKAKISEKPKISEISEFRKMVIYQFLHSPPKILALELY